MVEQSSLVSVIIPVFNRFQYVKRAVDSVLAQSYKNWEIIIVDDCSSQIYSLDSNWTSNIKLIRNDINLGSGLSRQNALKVAKGEFVAFLDSDDFYHPDFLKETVFNLISNIEVIGVYVYSQFTLNNQIKSQIIASNIMPTLFEHKRPWTTCSWLWRKNEIAQWKSLRTNQDSLFEIDNSLVNNKINCIPLVLCYIDKDTKENTIDLVGNLMGELNRNFVVNYALNNYLKFKEDNKFNKIKLEILNRIYFVSTKLIKYGEKQLIFKNGIKLIQNYRFKGLILIMIVLFLKNKKELYLNMKLKSLANYFL